MPDFDRVTVLIREGYEVVLTNPLQDQERRRLVAGVCHEVGTSLGGPSPLARREIDTRGK